MSAWNKEVAFQFLTNWEIMEDEPERRWFLKPKDQNEDGTLVTIDFSRPESRQVDFSRHEKSERGHVSFALYQPAQFSINPDPRGSALTFYSEVGGFDRMEIRQNGFVTGVAADQKFRAQIYT